MAGISPAMTTEADVVGRFFGQALRSALLRASRRMRPSSSWFETREDALLTRRVLS
jgi:hypothetical protein